MLQLLAASLAGVLPGAGQSFTEKEFVSILLPILDAVSPFCCGAWVLGHCWEWQHYPSVLRPNRSIA